MEDIYEATKQILKASRYNSTIEEILYENFFRFNASYYFSPSNCHLSINSYGISAIPDIFNHKVHDRVKLSQFINGKLENSIIVLPHQIYVHDLVKYIWKHEHEGEVTFEIECIRKKPEKVNLNEV